MESLFYVERMSVTAGLIGRKRKGSPKNKLDHFHGMRYGPAT